MDSDPLINNPPPPSYQAATDPMPNMAHNHLMYMTAEQHARLQLPNVTHVVVDTTADVHPCVLCQQGTVIRETDVVVIVLWVLLALLTFPFGLALFCCIPTRKRCQLCRQVY